MSMKRNHQEDRPYSVPPEILQELKMLDRVLDIYDELDRIKARCDRIWDRRFKELGQENRSMAEIILALKGLSRKVS